MRLLFDLKKIKGSFNYRSRIKLRLKVGQSLTISSEYSDFKDGSYAFLERQMMSMHQISDKFYVEVSIVAESGVLLAQITVFFAKFRELNKLDLKNNNEVYTIYYSLTEIADDDDELLPGTLRRTSTNVDENNPKLKEQAGKLEILRLGILVYEFAQRLDPLIFIYHTALDLFLWKNPYKTVSMGIILTLIIYNLKTTIFVAALLLYFGKDFLFKKLYKLHAYKNFHKRLIVPEENAYFIQNSMDNYCLWYQKSCEFLFNDDKTVLIHIINLLCKMGTFLIVLLFFFDVEHLVVMALWTLLFLTSPFRKPMLKYIKPFMEFVVGQYSKIVDKITSGISSVLGSKTDILTHEMTKEFYFYKYERWWMLQGWLDEKRKYSDEEYECIAIPRQEAPEGWAWIEEWKIDFSGEVDSDGYQYSNDFKTDFNSNNTLAVRRRRRWKRTCSKLRDQMI